MVCYAKPKNVLLLPCRHCSVCHTCLRCLRDEKCPLCRSVFSSYATLPLYRPPQADAPPAMAEASQQPAPVKGYSAAPTNATPSPPFAYGPPSSPSEGVQLR